MTPPPAPPASPPPFEAGAPLVAAVSFALDLVRVPEGYWLASNDAFGCHGTGDTAEEAVLDCIHAAVETFEDLRQDESVLGESLKQQLSALRTTFTVRARK